MHPEKTIIASAKETKQKTPAGNRVESIDLLRGAVMIIMALDHVRDYFHKDAFLYDPTDLAHTHVLLFFTRWITHFCAPVFVFLAGISAYLYGAKRSRAELSFFLFTRGVWLVFAEMFIVTLGWTFNPGYPILNLQVIWAIGMSMLVLSVLVYMNVRLILLTGLLLVVGHNLLDGVHIPGTGVASVFWAFLHDPGDYSIGRFAFFIHYPLLPWIGILAVGYCAGHLYRGGYDPERRKELLFYLGGWALVLFFFLRALNSYGDAAHWHVQGSTAFDVLSFLNVTKYPPSLLYILMTLGPALVFLALMERPLRGWMKKVALLGRVPMFYYLAHIYLIHGLAVVGALVAGYKGSDMIGLSNRVNRVPALKGYGFNLFVVYVVWVGVVLLLFPCCRWFDRYKRANQRRWRWLSYL